MAEVLQIYFDNKKDADEAVNALIKSTDNKPAPYLLQIWDRKLTVGKLSKQQDPDSSNYKYKSYFNRIIVENDGAKTLYNNEWK